MDKAVRKPRFRRSPWPSPFRLAERDFLILLTVSRYGLIQSHQLHRLLDGSRQNLLRRLASLFHAGLLDRPRAQMPVLASIAPATFAYSLTRDSARLLHGMGLRESPRAPALASGLMLPHELAVAEALSRIEAAAKAAGRPFIQGADGPISAADLPESWTVELPDKGRRERIPVVPDAAFLIGNPDAPPFCFFLEVDRGTMPVKRSRLSLSSIRRKLLAYRETRRSGIIRDRCGIPGFRVLLCCGSAKRTESMKAACREIHGGRDSSMFLFRITDECDSGSYLEGWRTSAGAKASL